MCTGLLNRRLREKQNLSHVITVSTLELVDSSARKPFRVCRLNVLHDRPRTLRLNHEARAHLAVTHAPGKSLTAVGPSLFNLIDLTPSLDDEVVVALHRERSFLRLAVARLGRILRPRREGLP